MDDKGGGGGMTLRYMIDEGKGGGGMLRGITTLVLVVIVFATVLGVALSRNEIFNPSMSDAQARRMNEETAALQAKNEYDQQLQQLELEHQRALMEQEIRWGERRSHLWEDVVSTTVPVLLLAILMLSLGGTLYLASRLIYQSPPKSVKSRDVQGSAGKVIPFPGQQGSSASSRIG